MLFPVFHIPWLGDGMTIALVAVTHVVLSHGFAIGMLTIIVLLETLAYIRNDKELETLARDMLKPVVIIITAVGAVTGAGIWFTVSVLAPGGISSLLRVFFWPWFIEWIAFSLEVIILLPYYFYWDHMYANRPKMHLALGWFYVVIAFISAFLITGILGFMLTPDGWVRNHQLLAAFFNPTFWPQLALRLFGGLALGALLTLGFVIFHSHHQSVEKQVLRLLGGWLLVTSLFSALAAWIYFSRVPDTFGTHKVFAILTSELSQNSWILLAVNITGMVLIIGISASALLKRKIATKLLLVPALIFALLFVVQFERIREFIRGPYLMPGYMYANQIPLSQSRFFQEHGYLVETAWYKEKQTDNTSTKRAGYTLFSANCGVCHTIGGINDIQERVQGRSLPGINVLVRNAEKIVPFMPTFSGNVQEVQALAAYLYELGSHRSPDDVSGRITQ